MEPINWNEIAPFASEEDWRCAFGEEDYTSSCKPGPFSRADVAKVIAAFAYSGERLDDNWKAPPTRETASTETYMGQIQMYGVFLLRDGRYGYVEAGADTTGWGCQDENQFEVGESLEALIPKIGDDGRSLLGFAGATGANVATAME